MTRTQRFITCSLASLACGRFLAILGARSWFAALGFVLTYVLVAIFLDLASPEPSLVDWLFRRRDTEG
jgi:hypothetical protein